MSSFPGKSPSPFRENNPMLKSPWRQWLSYVPMNHPTNARRRQARWRKAVGESAAEVVEVLENRAMLTTSLVFALQPGNAIAGHGLTSFTVDVINSGLHRRGTSNIDTSYTGGYTITANGPGVLDSPTYNTTPNGSVPGAPITQIGIYINRGIGRYLASFNSVAIDVAGTYTLTATSLAVDGVPAVPGNAVSTSFTISPDTASDHLVFLPGAHLMRPGGPMQVSAGVPFNVSVAMEDRFGNIDTSISKATAYLDVLGNGNVVATYVAEFSAGQATFTDVTLPAAPPSTNPISQDTLLAFGFAGPMGFSDAVTTVLVVSPTSN
jgi:hypothetical protein